MKYSTHICNSLKAASFLVSSFVLVLLSSCWGETCTVNYDFQIDINISPNDFEITKGDTLKISMLTHNTGLIDSVGNRIVNFPNFDPNLQFMLPRLDSTGVLEGFVDNEINVDSTIYTTALLPVQTLSTGLFFFGIDTTALTSKLEFEIVLNQPGTYGLHITPAIWIRRRTVEFPDRCAPNSNGDIDATLWIDGEVKKHYDLLEVDEMHNEENYWIERNGTKSLTSSFYFKVVE